MERGPLGTQEGMRKDLRRWPGHLWRPVGPRRPRALSGVRARPWREFPAPRRSKGQGALLLNNLQMPMAALVLGVSTRECWRRPTQAQGGHGGGIAACRIQPSDLAASRRDCSGYDGRQEKTWLRRACRSVIYRSLAGHSGTKRWDGGQRVIKSLDFAEGLLYICRNQKEQQLRGDYGTSPLSIQAHSQKCKGSGQKSAVSHDDAYRHQEGACCGRQGLR